MIISCCFSFRAFFVMTLCTCLACFAQSYPTKPVKLVVGFSVGGGTDTVARSVAKKLSEFWTQPVVIENKAGADGSIATEMVSQSNADGYTLVMVSNAHTITPFQRKLGYDPVRDFAPVSLIASTPNLLLVHPSLPVKNVKELIALLKSQPGKYSFGSSGTGTSPYLAMELFKAETATQINHVPYKGSSQAVVDLLGGHVQLMFGAVPTLEPHVGAGKLRAIAVSSPKRLVAFPDLPTVAETLPGFEAASWYGILAPAGTPASLVSKIQNDIANALQTSEVKNFIVNSGFDVIGNKPKEFSNVIQLDLEKWGKLIKTLN
jgi:tripartite-type tricarboxylate transporter receptor subunit TctC